MFSRIIIASEISPEAFYMLHCLQGLKNLGTTECLLVECVDRHETDLKISSFYHSIIEENLEKQKEILDGLGYDVKTRIVSGSAKSELYRIAVEEDFSMIVVGAEEHSLIGDVFLGGMAHEVIQDTRKPVLLVRISHNPDQTLNMSRECNIVKHVLFPTDFSDNANKAFEYVKKMVADGVKKVTLVHVIDKEIMEPILKHRLEEFREVDTKRLQELKEILSTINHITVDVQLRYGSPAAEIIKLIKEQEISLAVMGSQGRGFIKEVFLGSISHKIARHSSASVLLIPADR